MDIPWDDARLFLAVAETGSLSGAARRLKLGQPTVTRRLAALEYTLGTPLFRRSVEGAALTAVGERLVPASRKMAEWAGELQRAAEASDGAPRGLVRVTAGPFVAFDFVAPFAAFVAKKHPGLRLEVSSSVQYVDLARGEADIALRGRAPANSDLTVVHTLLVENAVFVSRELKARLPRKPKLSELPFVAWCPPYDTVPPNPQLEAAIPNFEPTFTADHFLVLLAAANAGVGAMILGRFEHRFSKESPLVPLDLELGPHSRSEWHLVCPKSALDIPRVRRVVELMVDELKAAKRRR